MDVYQNIWSNCDKTQAEKHSQLISDSVVNLGVFQYEDDRLLKVHVREVNCLLNSHKTRDHGLRLLADLVPQCAQQMLSAQCERWFKFCSDAVTAGRRSRSVVQACQVVLALLRDLPSLPELHRCVTSKASAALVLDLASADPVRNPVALECLYEYVRAAPGQCLQHKTVLEERMLHHLDHPIGPASLGQGAARLAGRVFAALPLPGVGGGNVAQSRAEARGRQLALLGALAHSLMDTLLDGVVEKESHSHLREHSALRLHPVEEIAPDPVSSRLASIARLSNTLTFVAEMITSNANSAITIKPDQLLSVVFRLLQVESGVVGRYKSQEHKLLAFFLPSLHQQALLLLRDMINSLEEGIDSYFGMLGDLLVAVLWSCQAEETKDRPKWCNSGLQTRLLAYAVLAELLRVSRGRHAPPVGLVAMVLQDASPRDPGVKLQKGLARLSLHKAAGKKKGYTVTSQNSSSHSGPLPRPERFGRLARVALVVAEMLFTHATHSMHHEDHRRLQSGVLAIVGLVVGASQPPDIYRDARVRVQLSLTLSSLSTAPHPCYPPPYALLTHFLQIGAADCDTQVASTCQTALSALSLIVANPKVELASQTFQQHQHSQSLHNGGQGSNADVGVAFQQQEEEEEEEEEKEQEEEEEEEEQEEEKEQEEETVPNHKEVEDKSPNEEEEREKGLEEQREGEGEGEEEDGGNEDKDKEEKEEDSEDKGEENRHQEEEKRVIKDRKSKQPSKSQIKRRKRKVNNRRKEENKQKMEEEEEEEGVVSSSGSGNTAKRSGGKSDPPAKRIKSSKNQDDGLGGSREYLTVEEMLKDFVEG